MALAPRAAPDLPPSAFWLTISPGPAESRGEAGNASVVTPPLVALPDPADEAAALAWLDANFVGQELLDRFAQFLPETDRFCGASGLGAEASHVGPPAAAGGFDAMPSAAEDPAVRQALAQAEVKRAQTAQAANDAAKADATAFWTQARALQVDRERALAIITASAGDWAAAVRALGEAA